MNNYDMLLLINGSKRSSGNESNFIYTPETLGINNVTAFRINKISIPYSFYNISLQTFTFTYNSVSYNITVPAGNYSAYQLGQYLQNVINAAIGPSSINIVFNQVQNTFTLATTPSTAFNFDFTGSLPTGQLNYSVGIQMGLINSLNLSTTPTSALTSPYAVNMSATTNIYMRSSILSLQFPSYFNGSRDTVIQSVPVDVNAFNWIIWQNILTASFRYSGQMLNQIDFQFVDDNGNFLNFNGLAPQIELQISFVN